MEKEQFKVCKYLLECGADVNLKDIFGNTVLHCAAILQKNLFFLVLMDNKGNPNVANVNGWTCLHLAAFHDRHKNIKKMLSTNKIPLHLHDREKYTPLHVASLRGNTESAKLLVQCGAEVNALSARGETPLLLACKSGNLDLIKFLLENGAIETLKDNRGNFVDFELVQRAMELKKDTEKKKSAEVKADFLLSKLSLFAVAGTNSTFAIHSQPAFASAVLDLILSGKEKVSGKAFESRGTVIDHGNGIYTGCFTCPSQCESFNISVYNEGKHCVGSPCEVAVVQRQHKNNTLLFSKFFSLS